MGLILGPNAKVCAPGFRLDRMFAATKTRRMSLCTCGGKTKTCPPNVSAFCLIHVCMILKMKHARPEEENEVPIKGVHFFCQLVKMNRFCWWPVAARELSSHLPYLPTPVKASVSKHWLVFSPVEAALHSFNGQFTDRIRCTYNRYKCGPGSFW